MTDLVAWVADTHQEHALRGLLARPMSLGIRPLRFEVYVGRGFDPGCRLNGPESLRNFRNQFQYAVLVLDHDGSGAERISATELEQKLELRLTSAGWANRSIAIVIEPELEAWIWSPSREVDVALGWSGRIPDLRTWLCGEGLVDSPTTKPSDPKLALSRALEAVKKKSSAALYRRLADRVSFQNCLDRSFLKLCNHLKIWFPPDNCSESKQ